MDLLHLDRSQRTELLARIDGSDARRLAALVLDGALGDIESITPPTVGTVMLRAADSLGGSVFNLGEVVVSQARVSLGGHEGWSMIVGHDPERALAVAIIDAYAVFRRLSVRCQVGKCSGGPATIRSACSI